MRQRLCSRTWEAEAVGDGRLGPTARASFALYNTTEDVDALVRGIEKVREVFA